MGDSYKNIVIAIFVLSAIFIVTFMLLFIHPNVGDERKVLKVRFPDIDKVNVGTRVIYGGKPVGEVVDIKEIVDEKNHRIIHDNTVYLYELELRVDSSVNVYNTDEISLRTSGLLGEKSVSITPQLPKPGIKIYTIDDKIIYATETGSVEQTFKEFKEVADKFDLALDNINHIMEDLQRENTFKNVARSVSNIAAITEALNKPKELTETINNIQTFSNQLTNSWEDVDNVIMLLEEVFSHSRNIVAALDQPERLSNTLKNVHTLSKRALVSWDSIDSALNEFNTSSKNITTFTYKINNEKSTLGKLFNEDDLYLRVTSLLNKGEVIFNDINHYGLLFHLDKGWQRLRARRMNLLAQLCSPQEFRNYFNDEIDNISTSLERVSMVLDRNQELYPCGLLLDDTDFAKVYAELLRRVSAMEEALKMYNQQLVDEQLPKTELCR